MKISFDNTADALYFTIDENGKVVTSEEVKPGVIIDLDSKNEVIGIEILNIKHRIDPSKLKQILVEVA